MGATSDIDQMVYACLLGIEAKADESEKEDLLELAKKRLSERLAQVTEKCEQLTSASALHEFLAEHSIFTANDRLRMLVRCLKKLKAAPEAIERVICYMKTVVDCCRFHRHRV